MERIEGTEPTAPWREGVVDQSDEHILIRYGGILDGDPEGVDIGLLGPDDDDELIVEFLPMLGIDAEAAEEYKRQALGFTWMVTDGEPHPWRQALRQTKSTGNAYGALRFLAQDGRGPLLHVIHPAHLEKGVVAAQPARVEGVGPFGRFVVYNKGKYVGVHLIRDDETIKGWIAALHRDRVAVVLTRPVSGGCVLRRIFEPYEDGPLVNDDGALTPYGLQVVVELIHEMHAAAQVMQSRVDDIREALQAVRVKVEVTRWRIPHDEEGWLRAAWKAVRGPTLDIEPAYFKSALWDWVARERHGMIAHWSWPARYRE